jgi:hypothetical protein
MQKHIWLGLIGLAVLSCGLAMMQQRPQPPNVAAVDRQPPPISDAVSIEPIGEALSSDAKALLAAAVAHEKGEILIGESDGKYSLASGAKEFCRWDDGPRKAAHWREVVNELQRAGMLEFSRNTSNGPAAEWVRLRVTSRGYSAADGKDK